MCICVSTICLSIEKNEILFKEALWYLEEFKYKDESQGFGAGSHVYARHISFSICISSLASLSVSTPTLQLKMQTQGTREDHLLDPIPDVTPPLWRMDPSRESFRTECQHSSAVSGRGGTWGARKNLPYWTFCRGVDHEQSLGQGLLAQKECIRGRNSTGVPHGVPHSNVWDLALLLEKYWPTLCASLSRLPGE